MRKFLFDIDKQQHHFSLERLTFILAFAFAIFIILILRLYYVTSVLDLSKKKEERFIQKKTENFWREDILDKNGLPLAFSNTCYNVGLNPKRMSLIKEQQQNSLKEILNLDLKTWEEFQKKNRFTYLKKNLVLTPSELKVLKSISPVVLEKKIQRTYPLAEATSHLLGFISPHGVGLEGLEFVFDHHLKQNAFNESFWQSPRGEKKYLTSVDRNQGKPLVLSIDSRAQALLYQACQENFQKYPMKSLSAVLLDIKDFSLTAAVTYPSYNPHQRPAYSECYRMKALADTFEPGSVIKPVTMAFLLERNPELKDRKIKTYPGYYSLDKEVVRDIRYYGTLSLEEILIYSSNVGISKLTLENAPGELLKFWKQFDLIQGSQIEFRPEGQGFLPSYIHPGSFSEATLSFGYGLKMNLVQLAQIYATMIGDGCIQAVTLLKQEQDRREKVKIFSENTTLAMRQLLKAPVEKGTARRAYSDEVTLGGKTGTVRLLNEQGVYEKVYNSYFVGFFPVENPQYILAVYADTPEKEYYGGIVCAPLARKIAPAMINLP